MPDTVDNETKTETAAKQESAKGANPRAFTQMILLLDDGDAHEQLSQDFQQLLRTIGVRARETMKSAKGSITLKITVSGDHKDVLDVGYDIKLDEPKKRRQRTVLWADKAGNFTEKNPRQVELPMGSLRDVSKKRRDEDDGESA